MKIMDAGYCLYVHIFMNKIIKSLKPFNFNNSNQLRLLPLVWCCPMVAISNWSVIPAHRIIQIAAYKLRSCLPYSLGKSKSGALIASVSLGT